MKSTWKVFVMAVCVTLTAIGSAGVIVPGLDDGTALGQYSAARNGLLNEVADITTGEITLAARFNPDVTQQAAGPVIVIENGGTSNGTGLYLAGGNLVFVAKAENGRYSVPTSLSDTVFSNDGTGKSMAVDLGAVNFGVENNVYVSMDLHDGLLFASINGITRSFAITGSGGTENLDGNRSVSFLGLGPIPAGEYGWLGGLLEENTTTPPSLNHASTLYPQLFWMNTVPMIQTAGYGNQLGQVFAAYIPEPATLVLLGLGAITLRRRK